MSGRPHDRPHDRTAERICALVSRSDGVSRIDLQDALDLAPATVTSAVARLLRRGDLVEQPDPARRTRSGRRPGLLRLAGERPLLGVVSWDRSRLRATVATYGAEVVTVEEHPTDRGTTSSTTTGTTNGTTNGTAGGSDVLELAMASLAPPPGTGALSAVVVSVPAPYQRGVGSPTYRRSGPPRPETGDRPRWIADFDSDPAQRWSDRLGVPVLFENDANLAMIGEAATGVAAGLSDVVYLKLGERGTGSALLIGRRIHRGASGFAGELAHLHVDDDGPLCACGGRGCLSTRLGPALMESVRTAYADPLSWPDVLRLADAGDPGPARILGDVGRTVGRALADLVTFLNPAAIVVDGALGPAARFVVDGLREPIDRYTAPVAASSVRILVGTLGERADLHGAIALTRQEAVDGRSRT